MVTITYIIQMRSGPGFTWGEPEGKHTFKGKTSALKNKRLRKKTYPEFEYRIIKRTEEVI